jgi:hypothetical protein
VSIFEFKQRRAGSQKVVLPEYVLLGVTDQFKTGHFISGPRQDGGIEVDDRAGDQPHALVAKSFPTSGDGPSAGTSGGGSLKRENPEELKTVSSGSLNLRGRSSQIWPAAKLVIASTDVGQYL